MAWLNMEWLNPDHFLLLKSLHIFGVILFLGNIIVTAWWKIMADRTRNPTIIAFAQRQVTLTDFVFTASGAGLVIVTGVLNSIVQGLDPNAVYWLGWGYGLFIMSGLIWVFVLLPIQYRQAKLAKTFEQNNAIPPEYWALNKIWMGFGAFATILPLLNIYFMVIKPTGYMI